MSQLSQQTRTSRLPQAYTPSSSRDENASQSVTSLRSGAVSSIWNAAYTQNRDTTIPARGLTGQSWPRVSPTDEVYPERTLPNDTMPVASVSGFSRNTDERNWNQHAWTSPDPAPSAQRTADSSPPSRARDSYLGPQDQPFGHALRNSISRPASLLEDDQENRGFASALNGNLDMHSRRQDSRAAGFRSLADASSRDPSLPPSRGTNGSPAMQERFAFTSSHTPSNSIGLPRTGFSAPSPYTASPTNPGLPARSFDSGARWGQQYDANNAIAGMASLSLEERPPSNANNTGFNATSQAFSTGFPAQGVPAQAWPNNGQSRVFHDSTPVNGIPATTQAGYQFPAQNRNFVPSHVSPTLRPPWPCPVMSLNT